MPKPAYLTQPNIQRIPNLLHEIMEGELLIPRFQRPFVWNYGRRLDLMDSILKGVPIGSILVWRTKVCDLATYDNLGPFKLHRAEPSGETRQYLLDGHQRLGTLYGALAEGLAATKSIHLDSFDDDNQDQGSWPIYYDLAKEEFCLASDESPPPPVWIPLSKLFDPYELHEFQAGMVEAGLPRGLVNRAESLASTFKDYSIPVIPIVTDDMELATISFKRINSAGTSMSEVHMVRALTWTPGFDLTARFKEALEGPLASEGWSQLEEQMLLNVIKAGLGLDVYKAKAEVVKQRLQEHPEALDEAVGCILEAIGFLRKGCSIYGPRTLPYSFQIVVIADFMKRCSGQASPESLEALRRWFWITTYTERFRGMNSTILIRALSYVWGILDNPSLKPEGMDVKVQPPGRFDYRAARSRAWALMLCELQPRTSPEGEPFGPEDLADYGYESVVHINPRWGSSPANRLVGPPREIALLARQLRENPLSVDPLVRESHGITDEVAQALSAGKDKEALRLRMSYLVAMERRRVGALGLEYHVPEGRS